MPPFKADQEEEPSPKMEAVDTKLNGLSLNGKSKTNGTNGVNGAHDSDKENGVGEKGDEADGDIYADAVLQCSIENKDACVMCSG
jgi:ribonucleoside-diphosphate reductase subunit M1